MSDRRAHNSTLRPKSLKRQEQERAGLRPKKPKKRGFKKPDIAQLLKRGDVTKASKLTQRKPMRKIAAGQKGWWDVAMEVWAERPHECEVCGAPIAEPAPINFSHLLPRGAYRKYKRDHRNLVIKCAAHHQEWHDFGPENLQVDPQWKKVCALYFQLHQEANVRP